MAYHEVKGNLFATSAKALVNTVNCVGVMGKGIALEFRRRYPEMFNQYQLDCHRGLLQPGKVYYYPFDDKLILNFAVKNHWKYPSKLAWIESCLCQFVEEYSSIGITSIAFPWMGAMNGGIPLTQIKQVMRKYLQKDLPNLDIEVYDFDPAAPDPLFELLLKISVAEDPERLSKISNIQPKAWEKILRFVRSGSVTSLANLEDAKVAGATTIDKLYGFLAEQSRSQSNQTFQQLSLF